MNSNEADYLCVSIGLHSLTAIGRGIQLGPVHHTCWADSLVREEHTASSFLQARENGSRHSGKSEIYASKEQFGWKCGSESQVSLYMVLARFSTYGRIHDFGNYSRLTT